MKFDYISETEYEGCAIEYGVVLGNSKIVYIKAGMGGSYRGYENKYLIIAKRLNLKYGCSVICASNPLKHPITVDKTIIESFITQNNVDVPEMFFFGHSNGGVKGLELAANGVPFRRMVIVNTPLMLNFHKTKKWIKDAAGSEIVAVYGENDPSFGYVPFLECNKFGNVEILRVAGADHNFKGCHDEFIALSERIFS